MKIKKQKAMSLLEVVVVLAIVSLTMVSAMALISRANSVIKDNEIQDTANEILIQSFELLRTPQPVKVLQGGFSELSQSGATTVYTMEFENILNRNGYLRKANNQAEVECSLSSEYNVEAVGSNRPYPICLRISILPVAGPSGINYYNITINLEYIISEGTISENYILTRNESFVQIL